MKVAVAAVLAAGAASACCIGPLAFVLLGVGAFGASLAVLEPYRPALIVLTAVLLGAAFRVTYGRKADCGACSSPSRSRARTVVWIAAVLTVTLVTFPYYVGFLF
ncbi:mercuric transporter MerT family protein [Luteitalea sp.]